MVLSLLQERRSIRKFKPQRVEEQKVDQLLEALLRAPSSRGINPWEFVVVDEPAILEQLAAAKAHGSAFLAGAPLAIVVCADTRKSDVWVEDCSIAAILLQLAAQSLGLGSCWAQIRLRQHSDGGTAEAYVLEALALPEGFAVEAIIGLGYADETKAPHDKGDLDYGKIHHNAYSK